MLLFAAAVVCNYTYGTTKTGQDRKIGQRDLERERGRARERGREREKERGERERGRGER